MSAAPAGAPVRVGLRVGSLADLFDPHEPGPLAGRRIIEASVAAYLSDRRAELPGDGDPVIARRLGRAMLVVQAAPA